MALLTPEESQATPDSIPALPSNVYELEITSCTQDVIATKRGPAQVIQVVMRVVNNEDEELNGRTLRDMIFFEDQGGKVALKRLALSAGLRPDVEGLEDETVLVDRIVKAKVKETTFKDGDESVPINRVSRYLVESDNG